MQAKSPDVIIAAPLDDIHARIVNQRINELGFDCSITDWNWSDNSSLGIAAELNLSNAVFDFEFGGIVYKPGTSIWWRRPSLPHSTALTMSADINSFVSAERKHALLGLLRGTVRMVNDPQFEDEANYKPYQLAVAKQHGFKIPETFITNDESKAARFINSMSARGKETIFKPLSGQKYHMAETRKIIASELDAESLQLAPVIFQEFIERSKDIRVFVAGNDVFSVECYCHHNDLVDWRLDPLVEYRPIKIEPELESKLVSYVTRLGLESGSIDLRTDLDGNYVFFEINPAGQFLFMETDSDYPVSRSMAKLLLANK